MNDELETMRKIAELLEPLDAAARARVLGWVVSALDITEKSSTGAAPISGGLRTQAPPELNYATFAELFHAAGPRLEKEKALLAAFWIQRLEGEAQFGAQQVNNELKHIGYRASNITDALNQLIAERPNLVIQLTKSGSSKQARKTYKVTDAGIRRVAEMLSSSMQ